MEELDLAKPGSTYSLIKHSCPARSLALSDSMDSGSRIAANLIITPERELWKCTMTLFLVQHGEAKPESEDSERSLTERGAEIVGRMAEWAARMGIKVDEIRHSGKRRADQTATIFAKHLNPQKGVIAVKGLSPKDDVTLVAASLQAEQESIMLVGHLPHLSRLLSLVVTGNSEIEIVRFRNAGIVCLTQKEGKWAIDWVMQPDLF